jgi:hypothetical protein
MWHPMGDCVMLITMKMLELIAAILVTEPKNIEILHTDTCVEIIDDVNAHFHNDDDDDELHDQLAYLAEHCTRTIR